MAQTFFEFIKERTIAGIARAKAKGLYRGKERKLQGKEWEKFKVCALVEKMGATLLADIYDVSRSTVYRYIDVAKEEGLTPKRRNLNPKGGRSPPTGFSNPITPITPHRGVGGN